MPRFASTLIPLACLAGWSCAEGHRRRGADVITQHGDAARSGVTDGEPRLRPELLDAQSFGRLYVRQVDGGIVAQPLFIKDVPTARHGRRDLLLVATETNWVYAFDAEDERTDPTTPPLAARQLQPSGRIRPAICDETPSQRVGITATPVIDPATHRMYAVARNADDHQYVLHALDLTADLVDARPPQRIQAVDPHDARVRFHAECQRNRPALLLVAGAVYAAFGSLGCDRDCAPDEPYRGWVMGFRASDLAPAGVFCTSPEATGHAGIWQGGGGLAAAGNRIFFQTGNGPGPLGDAFVGLQIEASPPGLQLAAVHRPANHAALDRADVDLGSGAPVWLPPGVLLGAWQGRALRAARRGDAGAGAGRFSGVREQLSRGCDGAGLWQRWRARRSRPTATRPRRAATSIRPAIKTARTVAPTSTVVRCSGATPARTSGWSCRWPGATS